MLVYAVTRPIIRDSVDTLIGHTVHILPLIETPTLRPYDPYLDNLPSCRVAIVGGQLGQEYWAQVFYFGHIETEWLTDQSWHREQECPHLKQTNT